MLSADITMVEAQRLFLSQREHLSCSTCEFIKIRHEIGPFNVSGLPFLPIEQRSPYKNSMLDKIFIQQPLQEQLVKVRNKRKNAIVLSLEGV